MLLIVRDAEAYDQVGQTVMPLRGEQGAADLHRVIIRAGKAAAGDMPGVVIQESQIEADVMADNRLDGGTGSRGSEPCDESGKHLVNRIEVGHHRIGDAGQRGDLTRNRPQGIHQLLELIDDMPLPHAHGTDFRDGATVRVKAGGLQIQRHIIGGEDGIVHGDSPAGTMIGLGWLAENGNAGSGHGGSSYQSVFGDLLYRQPGLSVQFFPPGFSRIYWLGGRQLRGASGREHS